MIKTRKEINPNTCYEEGYDDYKDWDVLIHDCQTMDLTVSEKEKVKQALQWLRKELGERFLNDAFEANHPLCGYITNRVPWTRRWMIWFAETIKELKETMEQTEYNRLMKELKNPSRDKEFRCRTLFDEKISVLRIARKFNTVFDIVFDPEVKVAGKSKLPDLKLIEKDTGTEIFVEISATYESEEERDVERIMAIIGRILAGCRQVQYSGRLKEKLSKEKHEQELETIERMIIEAVKKAKEEGKFQEILFENRIELGIAPDSDKQSLEKWAAEKGLETEGWSMDYKTDDISRIKQKIKKEKKQLPHNHLTMLIIINDTFFFLHNFREGIGELLEELCKYPHLWLLVVAGGFLAPGRKAICEEKEQHVYIDGSEKRYLILINPAYEQGAPLSTSTKILECFKQVSSN